MAYIPRNPNGQATMANSEPVVIASDQSAVSVSAASLPLPTGAATSAKQDTLLTELESKADLTPVTGSGSFTTVEDAVTLTLLGASNVAWQVTGTWSGVISFEASLDGSNWAAIWGYQTGTTTVVQATTVNGIFRCTTAGFAYARARYSTDTSGTAVVTGYASFGTSGIFNNFPQYGAQMIGKQEDTASATGDTGVPAMAIQKATPANTADSDGDYESLQMSAGRLWTSSVVTSMPTTTVQATDLDVRNLVFATDKVDASGTTLGANSGVDVGDVTINNAAGASAVNIQDGGNTITVDGTVSANATLSAETTKVIGTVNVASGQSIGVSSITAGDNNIGNVDIVTVPADPFGVNADAASATGSISAKLRAIATALGVTALDLGSGTGGTRTLRTFLDTAQFVGGTGTDTSATQRVSLATNVALPSGTNTIGKLAANSGVDIGDVDVTSLPALAAGTAAIGKLLPPDIDVTTHTNYAKKYYTSTGAVTDGIIWSPAAGKRWHVVSLYLQTSAAATLTIEDDKAGGDEVVWKGEFAANQGMTINFGEKYPLASGEDAADLLITTSAGNVYVTCTGYEI